ncbi:unnamed protein product [Prorocentrum cordatum]|uniref:Uncharacterized protein n=1 Tax=Prorocentrum cordatum TaxID=2364126 RepID=A0ABN9WJT3_9DINO|nr:unnamed protein product [Polarella glacialis]
MFGVRAAGTCRVADLPQPVGEHPSRPFDSPGRQEPAAVGPHSWHSESAGSCLPGAPWGWGEAGGSRSTSSRASTALRGRTPTCGGSEAPGRARARVPPLHIPGLGAAARMAPICWRAGRRLLRPRRALGASASAFHLSGVRTAPPRAPLGLLAPRASPFLTRPPPRRVPPGASHRRRGNTLAAAALTRASSRAAVLP